MPAENGAFDNCPNCPNHPGGITTIGGHATLFLLWFSDTVAKGVYK
jgi:hypothetical protein